MLLRLHVHAITVAVFEVSVSTQALATPVRRDAAVAFVTAKAVVADEDDVEGERCCVRLEVRENAVGLG